MRLPIKKNLFFLFLSSWIAFHHLGFALSPESAKSESKPSIKKDAQKSDPTPSSKSKKKSIPKKNSSETSPSSSTASDSFSEEVSKEKELSLENALLVLSPTHESYLMDIFPIVPATLPVFIPERDLNASLKELDSLPPSSDQGQGEKLYLKADLMFGLNQNKVSEQTMQAIKAYTKAISLFPDSPQAIAASYHLALLYLKTENYHSALMLAHRQEARWIEKKEWASAFRSVALEAYFLRKRYARAEDYLWELAGRMNRDELTPHLSLRYGDSVFWQGKYQEAADWYEKMSAQMDETQTQAGFVSRLYYAEALFRLEKYSEAKQHYEIAQEKIEDESVKTLIRFRLLQCELVQNQNSQELADQLKVFSLLHEDKLIGKAASLQWARLAIRKNETQLHIEAKFALESVLELEESEEIKKEALEIISLVQWKLGLKKEANENFVKMADFVKLHPEYPLAKEMANIVILALLEEAPLYRNEGKYAEILLQADKLSSLVSIADQRVDFLIWVARAYIESGMTSSGARLFERLLFQLHLEPKQQNLVLLELARSYGLMGEIELMGKTLAQVKGPMETSRERQLYHSTEAAWAISEGRFADCATQFEALLKTGLTGEELFKYALQGSSCARQAGQNSRAEKFISLLGINTEDLSPLTDAKLNPNLKYWQILALFEKVNLLALTSHPEEASALFEKIRDTLPQEEFSLETTFLIVDTYLKQHHPDAAASVWKDYVEKFSSRLPQDFGVQYGALVDMLAQVELIPGLNRPQE